MYALPANNPVQGTIDHMPQGSNLGPPSQHMVQPNDGANMPNAPMTGKLVTGYQSSSVPIRRAAAAGYGDGMVKRRRITGKQKRPSVPKGRGPANKETERAKLKEKRMRYKASNQRMQPPAASVRDSGGASSSRVREVPLR